MLNKNKIDMHAHYGAWPFGNVQRTKEDTVNLLNKYHIQAMLFSSSKAILYDMSEGNHDLFEFLEYDDRFFGYVTVNPNDIEGSIKEVEQYKNHPKFKGLKYHPVYCNLTIDCEEAMQIYEFANNHQLPVLIHAMGNTTCSPLRLINVNKKFPDLVVIGAHSGGTCLDLAMKAAKETNHNVYFDLSCTDITKNRVEYMVRAAGEDRVLFGSDYDLIDPIYIMGEVEEADLSKEIKDKIYFLNAKKLFELG